jgi:hypothetical protein
VGCQSKDFESTLFFTAHTIFCVCLPSLLMLSRIARDIQSRKFEYKYFFSFSSLYAVLLSLIFILPNEVTEVAEINSIQFDMQTNGRQKNDNWICGWIQL